MTATEFNRLIQNNCAAAIQAVAQKQISIQAAIGILEIHKQVLVTVAMSGQLDRPMIQPATILPSGGKQ